MITKIINNPFIFYIFNSKNSLFIQIYYTQKSRVYQQNLIDKHDFLYKLLTDYKLPTLRTVFFARSRMSLIGIVIRDPI